MSRYQLELRILYSGEHSHMAHTTCANIPFTAQNVRIRHVAKIEKGDYISMTLNMATIKQRLLAKQAELHENIGSLTEAHPTPVGAIEASDGPQDFEDVAVDFLETQKEQSLEVNSQALLTEVQAALQRIADGTYGKCVVCGEPIPEKRLEAIPWAARCVKDEEQLEERNISVTETYDADLN